MQIHNLEDNSIWLRMSPVLQLIMCRHNWKHSNTSCLGIFICLLFKYILQIIPGGNKHLGIMCSKRSTNILWRCNAEKYLWLNHHFWTAFPEIFLGCWNKQAYLTIRKRIIRKKSMSNLLRNHVDLLGIKNTITN